MTPVCIDTVKTNLIDAVTDNCPAINTNSRPLLRISGDVDPQCPPIMLYSNAAKVPLAASLSGGHSFEERDGPYASADSMSNVELAATTTADFLGKALL